MINFDDIDTWHSVLTDRLAEHVPDAAYLKLTDLSPDYIEDALDFVLDLTDRNVIMDATLNWLRSDKIVGFHGTRLVNEDIQSIQENGLIPLRAEARRARLVRALSYHHKWPDISDSLAPTIQRFGPENYSGVREGQVHLTLSRSGLVNSFNHYLKYGSEFDIKVAQDLLGQEGLDLLAKDGKPYVLGLAIPGDIALKAAHPFFTVEDVQENGEIPNIVREFLEAWAFRHAKPSFLSSTMHIDRGMIFCSTVPSEWIMSYEEVESLT